MAQSSKPSIILAYYRNRKNADPVQLAYLSHLPHPHTISTLSLAYLLLHTILLRLDSSTLIDSCPRYPTGCPVSPSISTGLSRRLPRWSRAGPVPYHFALLLCNPPPLTQFCLLNSFIHLSLTPTANCLLACLLQISPSERSPHLDECYHRVWVVVRLLFGSLVGQALSSSEKKKYSQAVESILCTGTEGRLHGGVTE